MNKRLASLLLSAALAVGMCVPAFAAKTPFTDIASHWGRTFVERAYELNFVKGATATTFAPNDDVSTAQLSTMMTKVFFADKMIAAPAGAPWWEGFCLTALDQGLLEGTAVRAALQSGKALADAGIHEGLSRLDASQMLFNLIKKTRLYPVDEAQRKAAAAQLKDFDSIPEGYREAVTACYVLGLMKGSDQGNFDGAAVLNRAQSAVIMCNLYDLLDNNKLLGQFISPDAKPEPPKPVEPAKPDPKPEVKPDSELDQLRSEMMDRINAERKKNGAAPLKLDPVLCQAAQIRAQELTKKFSHDRPNGTPCFTVTKDVNFTGYKALGENIAAGYPTADALMDGWMGSAGHRANILDPRFDSIGIGFVHSDDVYRYYAVQFFAGMD